MLRKKGIKVKEKRGGEKEGEWRGIEENEKKKRDGNTYTYR